MVQKVKPDTAVIYLAYIPYGTALFERFLDSYLKYEAGRKHDLFVLFNGSNSNGDLEDYFSCLNLKNITFQYLVSKEQYDIGAYLFAGRTLNYEHFLFLNTYSEILAPNWLANLYNSLMARGVGAVGCTGSWGNYSNDWSFFSLKSWKALSYWILFMCNFKTYLSPHLRTNAFMIRQKLLLRLKYYNLKPYVLAYLKYRRKESKLKTLHFEHGIQSMTNQMAAMNLEVLIVDKNGNSYSMKDWHTSFTFWNGDQENLMISDNQTANYNNGDFLVRSNLRRRAWNIQ